MLDSPAIELVEALARGTDVDIENVNVGIRIFFPGQHGVLGGIHAADLGAVFLAAAGGIPAPHALDEHDGVGVLAVRGTQQRAAGGAGGVGQTLKLQRGDDVLRLGIGKFIEFIQVDGIIARGYDDGAVLFLDKFVLLLIVNGSRRANLGASDRICPF